MHLENQTTHLENPASPTASTDASVPPASMTSAEAEWRSSWKAWLTA